MNTKSYIDRLRDLTPTGSNYAVAQLLETTDGAIAHYVHGRRQPDLATCVRIAELLGVDPLQVIADVQAERETDEVKRARWRELSRKRGRWAAMLLIGCVSCLWPSDASSAISRDNSCYQLSATVNPLRIMRRELRRLRRELVQLFAWRGSGRFPAFGS